MIIAITGHRPDRIADPDWVVAQLRTAFINLGATTVVQGGAAGADLLAAKAAFELGLGVVSVLPWAGHSVPYEWRELHHRAKQECSELIIANPSLTFPGNDAYGNRNRIMVSMCNQVVAVWDGKKKGGTYYTVRHAEQQGMPVTVINPDAAKHVEAPTVDQSELSNGNENGNGWVQDRLI